MQSIPRDIIIPSASTECYAIEHWECENSKTVDAAGFNGRHERHVYLDILFIADVVSNNYFCLFYEGTADQKEGVWDSNTKSNCGYTLLAASGSHGRGCRGCNNFTTRIRLLDHTILVTRDTDTSMGDTRTADGTAV